MERTPRFFQVCKWRAMIHLRGEEDLPRMVLSFVETEFSVRYTRNFTSSLGFVLPIIVVVEISLQLHQASLGFIHRHPANEVGGGEWQLVTAIPE